MVVRICAPDIVEGDAVGNHLFGVARLVARSGFKVKLYTYNSNIASPEVHPVSRLFTDFQSGDLLFVSYSIYDKNLGDILRLPGRKICYFHGVTDPSLFSAFDSRTETLCSLSLEQLPQLKSFNLVLSNSHSSSRQLAAHGVRATDKIIPPVFADSPLFSSLKALSFERPFARKLLIVGRVAPHKCIEDAIEVLSILIRRGNTCTLSVIGMISNYEYFKFLVNRARRLGVLDYVHFLGMLTDIDLLDCYVNGGVLLVMSRHEGFCVPILEASYAGLPVFSRAGTAADELHCVCRALAQNARIDAWADAVSNELERSSIDRVKFARGQNQQANEILCRANDKEWLSALSLCED